MSELAFSSASPAEPATLPASVAPSPGEATSQLTAASFREGAPPPADELAAALVDTFTRRQGFRTEWSPARTLTMALLTFGIGPLLLWPRGWRALIGAERWQFQHLAEWVRLRLGSPSADRLTRAVKKIRPRPWLSMPAALLGIVVATIGLITLAHAGWPMGDLLNATYSFGRGYSMQMGEHTVNRLFIIWATGLTVGYTLHVLAVLLHARAVRRATEAFFEVTSSQGLPSTFAVPPMTMRFVWTAGMLLLCLVNAVWSIPLTLAGGWQRRYAGVVAPRMRAAIADRISEICELQRPVQPAPQVTRHAQSCDRRHCDGVASALANFCPRCGWPLPPMLDSLT